MNAFHLSFCAFLISFFIASYAGYGFTPQNTACGFANAQDSNPTGEGLICHAFFDRIVANDFVIPAGEDWFIQAFRPHVILPAANNLDHINVYIYADHQGKPGETIASHSLVATASTLLGTYYGNNVFEIELPIADFYLAGHSDSPTVYWMGISGSVVAGSNIEMEIAVENGYGKPAMVNSGGGFVVAHPQWDGVFAIDAHCVPIAAYTSPNDGYCEAPSLAVVQDATNGCFGYATGPIGQSFTATSDAVSGVGVKLVQQSRGREITLAIWDKLPAQNGAIIASVTTHTYGDKWVAGFFENEVALTQGQKYYILVTGGADLPCVLGAGDVYSGGTAHGTPNYIANWDYDLTFRVYDCQQVEDDECTQINKTTGYANAHLSSKGQSQFLATDIHTPVGQDFLLEELLIYGWTLPGNSIVDCDITVYKNDQGKPGVKIATFLNTVPISKNFATVKYGFDVEEIKFQIPPLLLPGTDTGMEVYWISFKLGTTFGDAYITTDTFYNNGHPLVVTANNGETWEAIEGTDMSYMFSGQCFPSQGQTCQAIVWEAEQPEAITCLSQLQWGMAQSYTAVSEYATGAAVKFESVSYGYDLEIALWDGLPNAGGSELATKTQTTAGEQWLEVYWDHKIPTTPGQVYYLIFNGSGLPCLLGTTNNSYPSGKFYKTPNFEPTEWNLAFKTFGCAAEDAEQEPDCYEEVAHDFTFNAGAKNSVYDAYISANDLTVPPGENFTLTALSANIFAIGGVFEVEVIYYDDDGGLPANVIGGQSQIAVNAQKIVGEGSGLDVHEIKIPVAPFVFHGQPETWTTYWIALVITDVHHTENTYWQMVAGNTNGHYTAQKFGTGAWYNIDGLDGVYKWEGHCSIMVATLEEEFDGFSYYPNPARSYLEISSPAAIDGVEIYNALGQRVNAEAINSTSARVDISSLARGIYFMHVKRGDMRRSYKFIKE